MTSFYRLMLGRQSMFATEDVTEGFIGVDYGLVEDLTDKFPDD